MKRDTLQCNLISEQDGAQGSRMNKELLVHGEVAEGVIVLACVYCLSRLLYRGGLKFKVYVCACVCV